MARRSRRLRLAARRLRAGAGARRHGLLDEALHDRDAVGQRLDARLELVEAGEDRRDRELPRLRGRRGWLYDGYMIADWAWGG